MRERLVRAAGLALVGLSVVACSGDDEPGTLPDVTPTGTSASAASPSQPPSGDPTAQLEAEITAFYELYVNTINQSWTSEEALQRRREMFSDSCAECLAGYQFAQRAHAENLELVGGAPSVTRVRIDAVDASTITFSTFSDVPAAQLIDANGVIVIEFDEGINTQTAYQAQRTGQGTWIIVSGHTLS